MLKAQFNWIYRKISLSHFLARVVLTFELIAHAKTTKSVKVIDFKTLTIKRKKSWIFQRTIFCTFLSSSNMWKWNPIWTHSKFCQPFSHDVKLKATSISNTPILNLSLSKLSTFHGNGDAVLLVKTCDVLFQLNIVNQAVKIESIDDASGFLGNLDIHKVVCSITICMLIWLTKLWVDFWEMFGSEFSLLDNNESYLGHAWVWKEPGIFSKKILSKMTERFA